MDLKGSKLVLVGGAGLIGSHTVDRLLQEDVGEIIVYDNLVRGRAENLADARSEEHTSETPVTATSRMPSSA